MSSKVSNRLAQLRKERGIGASELARRVNASRQTIHAVEAGDYVPNTELGLLLARELGVAVGDIFALPVSSETKPRPLKAEMLSASAVEKFQPVRVCKIGPRWMSVPVSARPYYLPDADGVASSSGIAMHHSADGARLLIAGCDPAMSLLSAMVEQVCGTEVLTAASSSRQALAWLKQGKVHVAGSHLEDESTGEFNLPFIAKQFGRQKLVVLTFARWEEGLVVAPGNPKRIRAIEDLAHKGVRFINREAGSGSRSLLDRLISNAGMDTSRVKGYDTEARGHLAAAYAVLSGMADCCLATSSAARAFALDFIPLHSERYDLILRPETLDLPAAKGFLDVLQRSALRRKLETVAGYDTAQTGVRLV